MDMGIAQCNIIERSRSKVIKATFNLNSWIKNFEKSKKEKEKKSVSELHCAILISVALGIFFRGVVKNLNENFFNKKRTWIYWVIDKKTKEVSQFPSTSFQILNCYMIIHYEYLLPLWIAMTILSC